MAEITLPAAAVPQRKTHVDGIAVGLLVSCCFLWGLNQVAVKAALPEVPPLWQAAARCVGGALLVAIWAKLRGIPIFTRDATLRSGLFAGALFALEFVCIFLGLERTTASRMVVFIYLAPFVVALGMPLLGRHDVSRDERLSRVQMAGLLLAFAGVAWAFAEGFTTPGGSGQLLGDALGVLAGVLWGGTTLVIRGSRLSAASAEKTLLYQLAVSGVILTALAFTGAALPRSVSLLAVGCVLFQNVVVTFATYLVWFWLIGHYPATRLTSFTLLTPVFGLVLAVALLGEPVTLRLVTALIAVAAGIVLVNRRV